VISWSRLPIILAQLELVTGFQLRIASLSHLVEFLLISTENAAQVALNRRPADEFTKPGIALLKDFLGELWISFNL